MGSRVIVRDLIIALGTERALRLVRMHRNARRMVLGTLGAGYMAAHFTNYDNTTFNRTGVEEVVHALSNGRLDRVYRLLIGLYFIYQLEAAPTLTP